jgi:predicted alpha/beta hydrolase
MNGKQSLAFRLIDKGFDVWINNSRGTTYSKEHQFLDPVKQEKEYYDFSFHEIGIYDIPAVFKFVLSKVKLNKISIVSHGQGFTSMFVALTAYP